MVVSIIKDAEKYINLIHDLLNDNAMIADPKQLYGLIKLSVDKDGNIMGWEIEQKEITFVTNDILDCDEKALCKGDRFAITSFSYHFNPDASNSLHSYRIDLEWGNLHLNSDISLKGTYGDHLEADKLSFDITNFNCMLAIQLSLLYIGRQIYPADPKAAEYQRALNGLRRKLA